MALLEEHQDQLLTCDSFEEIMEYLKVRQILLACVLSWKRGLYFYLISRPGYQLWIEKFWIE